MLCVGRIGAHVTCSELPSLLPELQQSIDIQLAGTQPAGTIRAVELEWGEEAFSSFGPRTDKLSVSHAFQTSLKTLNARRHSPSLGLHTKLVLYNRRRSPLSAPDLPRFDIIILAGKLGTSVHWMCRLCCCVANANAVCSASQLQPVMSFPLAELVYNTSLHEKLIWTVGRFAHPDNVRGTCIMR
eukprot:365053-Chlamydomonas_euryale.AAC.23